MAHVRLVLTGLLLLFFVGTFAQHTNGGLAVIRETEADVPALQQMLVRTGQDTSRVQLLIRLANSYWFQRTSRNHSVDSCFQVAKQAYDLSTRLHFTEGSNEALFLLCKVYTARKDVASARNLLPKTYGEERVRLLLSMGEYFVFEFDANQREYSNALPLINEGIRICDSVHSENWRDECQILLAKYHFKQGNIADGKNAMMAVIDTYHKAQHYSKEAEFWQRLGNNMPESDSTYTFLIHAQEMAVHYYLLANEKKNAAYALRDLGILNTNHNRIDSGEQQLLRVVEVLQSIHEKVTRTTYNTLADFYRFTGKYDRALYYALEAVKTPEANEGKVMITNVMLGDIYRLQEDYANAMKYYLPAFDYMVARNNPTMYNIADQIANVYADSGDPKKALSFITSFIKAYPPTFYNDRQKFASTLGGIYARLGDHQKAEQYYLEMLRLNPMVQQENGRNLENLHTTLSSGAAFFMIGKFYTESGQFKKGKSYLRQSLVNPQYFDRGQELETYHLLFVADSALGNYFEAIKSFERHKTIFDSINSVARNKQLSELSIKYETGQRLKDIELLNEKQKVQSAALRQAAITRNITIGSAVVLLLVAVLAYNGYRNKQRSNKTLMAQRLEIDQQNQVLQELLAQQEEFLIEKDWLLKEIHHRVKNNLQIVMSLLTTQSAYLKNEDAVAAILNSESRVRSIALIHQKLYSGDSLASIRMPDYVTELVNYLTDGFDTPRRKIRFVELVDDVDVDLSQAVPLGLILNEAITNAIKYAFGEDGGEITIAFRRSKKDEQVILTVTDNGKGLPDDFNFRTAKSLGMELMQGLSKQLRAEFNITNDGGTTIQVAFGLAPGFRKSLSTAAENEITG